jgi:hypothetical protein
MPDVTAQNASDEETPLQRPAHFRRLIAAAIAVACLLATRLYARFFLLLAATMGGWNGPIQIGHTSFSGQIQAIVLLIVLFGFQVLGGIAGGVALGLERDVLRCIQHAPILTIGFFSATIFTASVTLMIASPRTVSWLVWAFLMAVACGIGIAVLLRIASARNTTFHQSSLQ